jgi:hypothetical protein
MVNRIKTDHETGTTTKRRKRSGNFVSYGKPRFPRARPFRFEWGNVNNGK